MGTASGRLVWAFVSFGTGVVQRTPAYEHPTLTECQTLPAKAEEPLQALHNLFVLKRCHCHIDRHLWPSKTP